jgi:pSer/pThr/pTyr-binding forkhead associated (FHA) protein
MGEIIHLRILQGPSFGQEHSVPPEGLTFGRSGSSDVVILDDKLSRKHCRFLYRAGNLAVEDLDSSNGTRVNGVEVRESQLKTGDAIAIGDTVINVIHASLRAPLTLKQVVDQPSAAAASAGRPATPVWVRVPAWLALIVWLLFLAYCLIPREPAG